MLTYTTINLIFKRYVEFTRHRILYLLLSLKLLHQLSLFYNKFESGILIKFYYVFKLF